MAKNQTNKTVPEKRRSEVGKMSRAARIVALVGAILGALLLWIYAIGYDTTLFESTFSGVEVTLTGDAELAQRTGFTIAEGQNLSSITVVAKGKRSELNGYTSADFRAVVDVSGVSAAGDITLGINVYSPNGVEVVSQSSQTVTLFIDEFTQRPNQLEVKVETGEGFYMSDGMTFKEATTNPLSILVSGPKSKLDEIEGAYVRFNLDGKEINGPIYGQGKIELRDKYGNVIDNPYIKMSESEAYVTISVTKWKDVAVKAVCSGGDSAATATASVNSIKVSGTPEALEGFDSITIRIDEADITESTVKDYYISQFLPDGVVNESGLTRITVNVTLPEMMVRTYTVPAERITVVNLPEGAEAEVLGAAEVTVRGFREAFEGFDESVITAALDNNRVKVNSDGSYSAKPVFDLGEGALKGLYPLSSDQTVSYRLTFKEETGNESE